VSFGSPVIWGSYRLTLENNFWGHWHYPVRDDAQLPYPIAATGNWAFLTHQSCKPARSFVGDSYRSFLITY